MTNWPNEELIRFWWRSGSPSGSWSNVCSRTVFCRADDMRERLSVLVLVYKCCLVLFLPNRPVTSDLGSLVSASSRTQMLRLNSIPTVPCMFHFHSVVDAATKLDLRQMKFNSKAQMSTSATVEPNHGLATGEHTA